MSENENDTPAWGHGPTRPPLRRDRSGGMLTGVCAGLGRQLNLDPVIFRILFVVFTLFGGAGLVAYAAAWLLIPADGESVPEARRLVDNKSLLAVVAVAVLLVLGLLTLVRAITSGFGGTVPVLVCAVAVVAYLMWRGESNPSAGGAGGAGGVWGPNGGPQAPQAWWQRPVTTYPAPAPSDAPGTLVTPSDSSVGGAAGEATSGPTDTGTNVGTMNSDAEPVDGDGGGTPGSSS